MYSTIEDEEGEATDIRPAPAVARHATRALNPRARLNSASLRSRTYVQATSDPPHLLWKQLNDLAVSIPDWLKFLYEAHGWVCVPISTSPGHWPFDMQSH